MYGCSIKCAVAGEWADGALSAGFEAARAGLGPVAVQRRMAFLMSSLPPHGSGSRTTAPRPALASEGPRSAGDEASLAQDRLAALLRLAYSGERAAALAYRGHWRSLFDASDRDRIRVIEEEEWHHRRILLDMLGELKVAPSRSREARAAFIGRSLGCLCHVSGWLAPMYGAGKLESRNIREYEVAARLAWTAGRREWVDRLLTFAEVEWEHEAFFRDRVRAHRFGRRLRLWPMPPPKESIRSTFARDTAMPESPDLAVHQHESPAPREPVVVHGRSAGTR